MKHSELTSCDAFIKHSTCFPLPADTDHWSLQTVKAFSCSGGFRQQLHVDAPSLKSWSNTLCRLKRLRSFRYVCLPSCSLLNFGLWYLKIKSEDIYFLVAGWRQVNTPRCSTLTSCSHIKAWRIPAGLNDTQTFHHVVPFNDSLGSNWKKRFVFYWEHFNNRWNNVRASSESHLSQLHCHTVEGFSSFRDNVCLLFVIWMIWISLYFTLFIIIHILQCCTVTVSLFNC